MQNDKSPDSIDIIINKINSLPSLSPVVHKIGSVMSDPDASASDIVGVLKLDPAIAGKVLRLANSAYIGIPRTVSSLQNAVVILGQRRIHYLVIAASTLSTFKPGRAFPFDKVRFWKHSVTSAIVSESIARHIKRYDPIEAEEVFCAGLLHDIGKLVLGIYHPDPIATGYKKALENKTPFFRSEEKELTHMRVGYLIAEKWNFPISLANAIRYHHMPARAERSLKLVAIVHVADIMVHIIGFNTVLKEEIPEIDERALERIHLKPERLRVIADNAIQDEKKLESMIDFFS